jgi:GTP pyrophosphokinase
LSVDYEAPQVYELVLEVSRIPGEAKSVYLTRVKEHGSRKAKILKCADRISNMIALGFATDMAFIERYTAETLKYVLPVAGEVDKNMYYELKDLVESRRQFLHDRNHIQKGNSV